MIIIYFKLKIRSNSGIFGEMLQYFSLVCFERGYRFKERFQIFISIWIEM